MVGRDMVLKADLVERALLHLETLAHQGPILRRECPIRESRSTANHEESFNAIGTSRTYPSGEYEGHQWWQSRCGPSVHPTLS